MNYKINQEDNHSNDYQNYMKPPRLNSELEAENAALQSAVTCWKEQAEMLQHQNDDAFAELRGPIDEQELQIAALKERVVTLEKLDGTVLIESLRAEIERLSKLAYIGEHQFDDNTWKHRVNELRQQLAASQLEAKRLRNGLIAWQTCDLDEELCDRLLSSPTSTEALAAYVDEKVKESHKVIPREGLVPHAYQLEATHNNAEYWYKWGHSAEAKEKGEQVICMAQAVFAWRNAAYAKAKEVSALTQQRDLAVEFIANVSTSPKLSGSGWQEQANMTLAAIKESET